VNGAATLVLQAGQAAMVLRVASAWQAAALGGTAIGFALMAALNSAAVADLASGAPVDIASAATTNIGASASPNVRITGTTGITSFGTVAAGTRRFLAFAAALTLTHNATSLILPGAANITTAAGDNAVARSLGSGNWVIERYTRAAGLPVAQMATARVLGRFSAGNGAIEEATLGGGLAFSGGALVGAPQPQTGSGLGQVSILEPALSAATVLPAGGTWFWFVLTSDNGGFWVGSSAVSVGIDAGGTTVVAGTTNRYRKGFCWRIA
jgi:hypothetical protein